MSTFRDALADTEAALLAAGVYCGHGYESEHDEAVALVLAAAGLAVTTGAEVLDEHLPEQAAARLADYLRLRTLERLPVAYIIGRAWLGPLEFKSDSRALVPRSPLMELIAADFSPWWRRQGDSPPIIVDVCCGGGSLGLLAAWALPDTRVELLDIDDAALALARENRALHGLDNVAITQGDLLSPLAAASVSVILANPPYVDAADMASLPPEYLHEPRIALAAGDDGLALVHTLLLQASTVLQPEGVLFLEVGNSFAALERAYPSHTFTWLQFEGGGFGVCVLTQPELEAMAPRAAELGKQV